MEGEIFQQQKLRFKWDFSQREPTETIAIPERALIICNILKSVIFVPSFVLVSYC